MNKFIITLLLIPFLANAQIRTFQAQESFAFTHDKQLHVLVASGMTVGIYSYSYYKSKDAGLALRMAIIFPSLVCVGKEVADQHISISDLGYGIGSVVTTAFIRYGITKWIKKRKTKKNKRLIDF